MARKKIDLAIDVKTTFSTRLLTLFDVFIALLKFTEPYMYIVVVHQCVSDPNNSLKCRKKCIIWRRAI